MPLHGHCRRWRPSVEHYADLALFGTDGTGEPTANDAHDGKTVDVDEMNRKATNPPTEEENTERWAWTKKVNTRLVVAISLGDGTSVKSCSRY